MTRKEKAWERFRKVADRYHYNNVHEMWEAFYDKAEDALGVEWPMSLNGIDLNDARWDNLFQTAKQKED